MPECCDSSPTTQQATAIPGPHTSMRLAFLMCGFVLVDDFTASIHIYHTPSPWKSILYCNVPRHKSLWSHAHQSTNICAQGKHVNGGFDTQNVILIHPDCHDMQTQPKKNVDLYLLIALKSWDVATQLVLSPLLNVVQVLVTQITQIFYCRD